MIWVKVNGKSQEIVSSTVSLLNFCCDVLSWISRYDLRSPGRSCWAWFFSRKRAQLNTTAATCCNCSICQQPDLWDSEKVHSTIWPQKRAHSFWSARNRLHPLDPLLLNACVKTTPTTPWQLQMSKHSQHEATHLSQCFRAFMEGWCNLCFRTTQDQACQRFGDALIEIFA